MKLFFRGVFFIGLFLIFAARACYAQPVSSVDLVSNAAKFDNTRISYEGEAIGDIMYRGNFAWVNLRDGANAIGVWLEGSAAKTIQRTGSYQSKGDWVEVVGIFHRACPLHGGDLDIHAETIRIVRSGRAYAEKFNIRKRNFALVLLVILGVAWILKQLKIR
ncbi:MAG: DNA-binding protein [Candidatus Omnitrophota bacterium]|nr:MAG: DNA-binding protein [Candidatus Omnitrophota bacterium]